MTEYYAFGPDAEVLGQAMLAFVNSTRSETIHPLLEYHQLLDIEPDAWYPQQVWLDVFSDLANSGNAMFDLVSVGMQMIRAVDIPMEMRDLSFSQVVMYVVDAVNAFNRGDDAGVISCERVDPSHIRIIACMPYPDDFLYGTFYGVAQEFLPLSSNFSVHYDDKIPCRERGGEATVIHVIWDELD